MATSKPDGIKITCCSDLHGYYPTLNGGDLLILAGDLTASDKIHQYEQFASWLNRQDYKQKIVIAGNHDNILQAEGAQLLKWCPNTTYLCDSGTEFEGLKIWVSPWTKTFKGMNPHCKAFTVDTEEQLAEKWKLIPNDIDILITHSPPWGILDKIKPRIQPRIQAMSHVGSESLRERVLDGEGMQKLKAHIFGHIHEGYGTFDTTLCKFINASHVNERYQPVNPPINIEI